MSKEALIEFYDNGSLENIISLEEGRYSQVVYLYFADAGTPTDQEVEVLRNFIRRRFRIPAEFLPIREKSIASVCSTFDKVLSTQESCVIDMTGGPEIFSAAAGYYIAQKSQKPVTLQQYDIRRDTLVFRHPESDRPLCRPELSVAECVALQGAIVMHSTPYDAADAVMEAEILRLWGLVSDVPKQWNYFCSLPGYSRSQFGNRFEKSVTSQHEFDSYQTVAQRLRKDGLMQNETAQVVKGRKYQTFALNVPKEARMLYRKGGNLLEMYCGLAVTRAGGFHDCHVSVSLDWDSRIVRHAPDVRNEIDVMAVYGHIPVLISCKNTKIENEYLYEIMIMAKHYGGRYARPVIVSSVENLPNIALRAKEMGILLIENVQNMSLDEFVNCFRKEFPTR